MNTQEKYQEYIKKLYEFFNKIRSILQSHPSFYYQSNIKTINSNELLKDTVKIIHKLDYSLEKIISNKELESINPECHIDNNLYIRLSNEFHILCNSNLIDRSNILSNSEESKKIKNGFKNKKNYETSMLIEFLKKELSLFKSDDHINLIEFGCGKIYQTQEILNQFDNISYYGIDKNEDLIRKIQKLKEDNEASINSNDYGNKDNYCKEKSNRKRKYKGINIGKSNKIYSRINIFNYFVTENNFSEIYNKEILSKSKNNSKNILFGLHCCGNLTSDAMKIFVNCKFIGKIYIIGCCLNLINEQVITSEKSISNEEEIYKQSISIHFSSLGYDNKGNYLDETIFYKNNCESIGYPISKYVMKESLKGNIFSFLSRLSRFSAMNSLVEDTNLNNSNINVYSNIYYKEKLYKSMFEGLMDHMEEFKYVKEYKGLLISSFKIDFSEEITFEDYVNNIYKKFQSDTGKEKLKVVNNRFSSFDIDQFLIKFEMINKAINEKTSVKLNELIEEMYKNKDYLIASYIIKMRFSKIVEYIIAVDRVLFLYENHCENIRLIKIFDSIYSQRNLMISAFN